MTTYRITSDSTTLGVKGATVSDDDLVGLNVSALISGGHIEPASAVKKLDKKDEN